MSNQVSDQVVKVWVLHSSQVFSRHARHDEKAAAVSMPSGVNGLDWAHNAPLIAVASPALGVTVARLPAAARSKLPKYSATL